MSYSDRIAARKDLRDHAGWDVHWRLLRLDTVWGAFVHNAETLTAGCESASRDLDTVQAGGLARIREWMLALQPDVFRWLLNFGASMHMLVEFSRQVSRTDLAPDENAAYSDLVQRRFAQSSVRVR